MASRRRKKGRNEASKVALMASSVVLEWIASVGVPRGRHSICNRSLRLGGSGGRLAVHGSMAPGGWCPGSAMGSGGAQSVGDENCRGMGWCCGVKCSGKKGVLVGDGRGRALRLEGNAPASVWLWFWECEVISSGPRQYEVTMSLIRIAWSAKIARPMTAR